MAGTSPAMTEPECYAVLHASIWHCVNVLRKRLNAGDGAAENEGVDVVGALIGVHGLQILRMPHHVVFDLDAVAAMHVAGHARDVERLAAIVALDDRNHLR